MSAEMEKLAARMEALAGPDREVDAVIWAATFDGYVEGQSVWSDDKGWVKRAVSLGDGMVRERKYRGHTDNAPRYTASLDAAMTLVPEGCLFHVRTLWDGPKTWGYAHIHTYGEDAEECDGKRHLDDYVGSAATLALALCVAALRARPATTGESGL